MEVIEGYSTETARYSPRPAVGIRPQALARLAVGIGADQSSVPGVMSSTGVVASASASSNKDTIVGLRLPRSRSEIYC
jgi:hypothetical protein